MLSGRLPLLSIWLRLWPHVYTMCEARPELSLQPQRKSHLNPCLSHFNFRGQKHHTRGMTYGSKCAFMWCINPGDGYLNDHHQQRSWKSVLHQLSNVGDGALHKFSQEFFTFRLSSCNLFYWFEVGGAQLKSDPTSFCAPINIKHHLNQYVDSCWIVCLC